MRPAPSNWPTAGRARFWWPPSICGRSAAQDACTLSCRDGCRDCKNACFPGDDSCMTSESSRTAESHLQWAFPSVGLGRPRPSLNPSEVFPRSFRRISENFPKTFRTPPPHDAMRPSYEIPERTVTPRPLGSGNSEIPGFPVWKAFAVQFSRETGKRTGTFAGRIEHLS